MGAMIGGRLIGIAVGWLLGRFADSLVEGPMDAMDERPDLEPPDQTGIDPPQWVTGVIEKEAFREFVAELNGRLEQGFRAGQLNLLMSKMAGLKNEEQLSSLFSVRYRGRPTALQISASGERDLLFVRMEGSGPTMDLVQEIFGKRLRDFIEIAEVRECRIATEEYNALLDLRFRELRLPLGLRWSREDLQWEQLERHFGLFILGDAVGSVVARDLPSGAMKLRQIAVSGGRQGMGLGKHLMEKVEAILHAEGIREFELHSRLNVAGFYEALGYEREGEIFEEIGMAHVKMRKRL